MDGLLGAKGYVGPLSQIIGGGGGGAGPPAPPPLFLRLCIKVSPQHVPNSTSKTTTKTGPCRTFVLKYIINYLKIAHFPAYLVDELLWYLKLLS